MICGRELRFSSNTFRQVGQVAPFLQSQVANVKGFCGQSISEFRSDSSLCKDFGTFTLQFP